MKHRTVAACAAIAVTFALSACGGGGSDTQTDAAPNYAAEVSLEADAPASNLDLPSSGGFSTSTVASRCGYAVPSQSFTGVVSAVHDGDTLTVSGRNIRLDSIDAPELKQSYGTQSRDSLASLVGGQTVTVHYAKIDKYGRTVGSVFTGSCAYVNLMQVQAGAAWHYKQYQCEQPAAQRSEFAAAQEAAQASGVGLWASSATAPWVYRNGVDPAPPTCPSSAPTWSSGASTSNPAPSSSTCTKVWVNGYRKSNGTWVDGYWRNSPGCA